ncbi:hypothetical protein PG993_002821 [Apiospora rasikravindrae]|uniref:Uncharacterized protein n=1 Tax=Apiospora rasikravindrae TaxID=990691 RepID=A0ABR1TXQ9_9PEZI
MLSDLDVETVGNLFEFWLNVSKPLAQVPSVASAETGGTPRGLSPVALGLFDAIWLKHEMVRRPWDSAVNTNNDPLCAVVGIIEDREMR